MLAAESQWFQETLWPTADIDLFLYGLTEAAAQQKLLAILTSLRRTIIRKCGVESDVYFVKTPNTITIGCGRIARPVQVH